jgi:hypothetical protein
LIDCKEIGITFVIEINEKSIQILGVSLKFKLIILFYFKKKLKKYYFKKIKSNFDFIIEI